MRQQGNEIVMDRDEFLFNSLLPGIACQLLAEDSGRDLSYWMNFLSEQAEQQFDEMSLKQRDEMINAYLEIAKNV